MNFHIQETGRTYYRRLFALSTLLLALGATNAIAQSEDDADDELVDEITVTGTQIKGAQSEDDADDELVDEITVTGTQIKGARISDALAVSVIQAGEIEAMGISSGDELFDSMPEVGMNLVGMNFFNEADAHAGGVNSVRGDVGAFNMRNMGTGNTLALINGRRMVDSAGYQTEEVGGAFVPVSSANTNAIPVYGIERVEVLRDGACLGHLRRRRGGGRD